MFFRVKKSEDRSYLQIVENRRENGRVKQHVIATLGRLEQLQDSGRLDALLQSGARFAEVSCLRSPPDASALSRSSNACGTRPVAGK